MSPIDLTPARIEQVNAVLTKFVLDFPKAIGAGISQEDFLSTYHDDIEWYDHAFLMKRVGKSALLGLHKSWNWCNQPFEAKIKAIIPTPEGAILEQLWVGKCANDIIRPDGEMVVKASGKEYECHCCMVVKINADGLVTRIDEYYNRKWDDGVKEDKYVELKL